jgi:hypothetical protein
MAQMTDGNQLKGTIPTELGRLTGLFYLYLCKVEIVLYGCIIHVVTVAD